MIFPKWLVTELIKKYEEKDIYLIQDLSYVEYKKRLLNKKIIKYSDFNKFIEETKRNKYTKFEKVSFKSSKLAFVKRNNNFIYDIKFKQFLYIRFSAFNEKNITNIEQVLLDKKDQYKKLIIDLRNNGGGTFNMCLRLLNKFLPEMYYLQLENKDKKVMFKSDKEFFKFKAIYIFLNENSASCSEIFSMVLRKKVPNVFLVGTNTVRKECTQHTITNEKYRFVFAISDGKWKVDNETVIQLQEYIKKDSMDNMVYSDLNSYFRYVLIKDNALRSVDNVRY